MQELVEIYVALLDEGIDVFRPVQAVVIGENKYRLLGLDQYDPDDEIWEFPPGSIVSGKKFAVIKAVNSWQPSPSMQDKARESG